MPVERAGTSAGHQEDTKRCKPSKNSPKSVGLSGQSCLSPVWDIHVLPHLPLMLMVRPLSLYKDCSAASIWPWTPRRWSTCQSPVESAPCHRHPSGPENKCRAACRPPLASFTKCCRANRLCWSRQLWPKASLCLSPEVVVFRILQ